MGSCIGAVRLHPIPSEPDIYFCISSSEGMKGRVRRNDKGDGLLDFKLRTRRPDGCRERSDDGFYA